MKQRMKDFRQWVKEHKGLLAVAGISVTVLVALVLCARNKDEIDHILSLLKKTVKNAPDEDVVGSVSINLSNATQPVLEVYDSETHAVTQQIPLFIRRLPDNWHHSAAKAEEAERLGIQLAINETLVDPHQRIRTVAYSLSHKKLLELASDAGAIYRFDSTVLINREIFDAYLERFHCL